MSVQPLFIHGLYLSRTERALHLWSDEPLTVLSSAVVGGELTQTRHIVNMHVPNHYDCHTPAETLTVMAEELGIAGPFVGLMTAANLKQAQMVVERTDQTTVAAILTVGVSHPVAAGVTEAASLSLPPGTINAIVIVDGVLTPAARANALITVTEAKTLALVEAGVRAPHGGPATGTGTDAVVVAATGRGSVFEYAGPIAPVGAAIAGAVRRAMQNALLIRNLLNRPMA
jgi:iron complex transport system ATP-binding protein